MGWWKCRFTKARARKGQVLVERIFSVRFRAGEEGGEGDGGAVAGRQAGGMALWREGWRAKRLLPASGMKGDEKVITQVKPNFRLTTGDAGVAQRPPV